MTVVLVITSLVLIHMSKGLMMLAMALCLILLLSMSLSFRPLFRRLSKLDFVFSSLSIGIGEWQGGGCPQPPALTRLTVCWPWGVSWAQTCVYFSLFFLSAACVNPFFATVFLFSSLPLPPGVSLSCVQARPFLCLS